MQKNLDFWQSSEASSLLDLADKIYKAEGLKDSSGLVLKLKSRLRDKFEITQLELAAQIINARHSSKKINEELQLGLYTKTQLEQASHPKVAAFHAQKFSGYDVIYDFCCGLGFDSYAFAKVAKKVVALEKDPLVAAFCKYNAKVLGLENIEVHCTTIEEYIAANPKFVAQAIWIDPDRRSDGARIRSADFASPSLDFIATLNCSAKLGVKISPATRIDDDLWKKEFIGFDKECKEQVLWRCKDTADLTVSLVDADVSWDFSNTIEDQVLPEELTEGSFLLEAHNSLIASGKTGSFFADNGFKFLPSARLGWTNIMPDNSPWYSAFKILKICSFRKQDINPIISQLNWGPQTALKKAGLEESAEVLRAGLKFNKNASNNSHDNIIFALKVEKRQLAIFCQRVS